MKIFKCLEDSSLLIKDACQTIQNEAQERKVRSFSMLLGILAASLL